VRTRREKPFRRRFRRYRPVDRRSETRAETLDGRRLAGEPVHSATPSGTSPGRVFASRPGRRRRVACLQSSRLHHRHVTWLCPVSYTARRSRARRPYEVTRWDRTDEPPGSSRLERCLRRLRGPGPPGTFHRDASPRPRPTGMTEFGQFRPGHRLCGHPTGTGSAGTVPLVPLHHSRGYLNSSSPFAKPAYSRSRD
jgi:hypothetical protein